MMRVCVIGGGLFGATAAILAARAGHEVHLYEAKRGLLMGATASTYSRLHRGFHYPRDSRTGRESRLAERAFRKEYGAAVIDAGQQFYIVPPVGSQVGGEAYRAFLDTEDLPFSEEGHVFSVSEPRLNLGVLQAIVRQKVADAGVAVHLGATAPRSIRRQFDRIVVATYSRLNAVLADLGCPPEAYRFQMVERPVVKLPEAFRDTSIVVIDGPFGCLDPLDATDLHVLGHVVHTIHASNTGLEAEVPGHLAGLIDRGLIADPPVTRFSEVVADLNRYVPGVEKARHIGSSYTVRCVLAGQEKTDARPTLTRQIDDQIITVLSGKLGTAVAAANRVCDLLLAEDRTVVAA
jgi:hypothetical protein